MENKQPEYMDLVDHYDSCFQRHGATPQGVDWPNGLDLTTRFKVMLNGMPAELRKAEEIKLLDVGCGYGALFDYLKTTDNFKNINYHGTDLSEKMIQYAQEQHGNYFSFRDILQQPLRANSFDYAIINGVFTEKRQLSQESMEEFLGHMLKNLYATCRYGFGFNVMSQHVDWYREELFYLPFDRAATIVRENCNRHFRFCADYGLYEYTVYVYKTPFIYD